jgi:hypothetical protein
MVGMIAHTPNNTTTPIIDGLDFIVTSLSSGGSWLLTSAAYAV